MRFYVHKLGCPKNDVDGDYIAARLIDAGHQPVGSAEDDERSMTDDQAPTPRPNPIAALTALIGARRIPEGGVTPSPHESPAAGVLRPVVFGANDGLVSNLALVMGVAGAAPAPGIIVLAGIAGLLAGAFSMAVGEYISVQSQRELLEYQVTFQRHQLATEPQKEYAILVGIYMGRGFSRDEAVVHAHPVAHEPRAAIVLHHAVVAAVRLERVAVPALLMALRGR